CAAGTSSSTCCGTRSSRPDPGPGAGSPGDEPGVEDVLDALHRREAGQPGAVDGHRRRHHAGGDGPRGLDRPVDGPAAVAGQARVVDARVVERLAGSVAADPLVGPDDASAVARVAGDALEAELQPVADLGVEVLAGDGPVAAPADTGPDLGSVRPAAGGQRDQRRVGLDPDVGLVAVGPDDVDDGGTDDDAVVHPPAVAGGAAEVAERVGPHVAGRA